MKKRKIILLSISITVLTLTSCTNDNSNETTNNQSGGTAQTTDIVEWSTGELNSTGEPNSTGESVSINNYITTTNGVDASMLTASYWTDMSSIKDNVLISGEAIDRYNEKAMEDNKYVSSDMISKDALLELIYEENGPSNTTYINGNAVDSSYYDVARNNRNIDGILENNEVRYGICVKRSEMKCIPTEERAYSNNVDFFRDFNVNSAILVNDPVKILHESKDSKWYFVQTKYTAGWILKENIAVCSDKNEWDAWQQGDFVIVTADKINLEEDYSDVDISKLELSMGTRLTLVNTSDYIRNGESRVVMNNYVVKLPARNNDGSLYTKFGFVPVSRDVHIGYLDYTRANVIELAFESLGDRYGWGGMYDSRDCSSFVLDIYRCFGIVLPRNSSEQANINMNQDVKGYSKDNKIAAIKNAGMGALLYFKGHIMIYLGEKDGELFVISAAGNMQENINGSTETININSVVVNSLNTKRGQNSSWLNDIEKIILVS